MKNSKYSLVLILVVIFTLSSFTTFAQQSGSSSMVYIKVPDDIKASDQDIVGQTLTVATEYNAALRGNVEVTGYVDNNGNGKVYLIAIPNSRQNRAAAVLAELCEEGFDECQRGCHDKPIYNLLICLAQCAIDCVTQEIIDTHYPKSLPPLKNKH